MLLVSSFPCYYLRILSIVASLFNIQLEYKRKILINKIQYAIEQIFFTNPFFTLLFNQTRISVELLQQTGFLF